MTTVDDSDPDIDRDQLQHLLQTAESIRKDGHDDRLVLTGLIHDLGRVLCLSGEPRWATVGDTFSVSCHFSDRIVFSEFSFYAWHRECEYDWLCDDHDRAMLPWVRKFNPYDLYSKSPEPPDWSKLRPYYADLPGKYLPEKRAF